ncbi:N2,N2-dimethylguanosine tRNA methyltransferase [Auriculariales sp. MPI-PUGE-AT-0066]|nr:N2,N2-dimethylguanosine tRNA methyltransferase [Auriculariales sp. MPI-PUGE-AT-0066]
MSNSKLVVPEGFTLHVEGSASVLLPERTDTFINPIQEFNRDLSVACISVWAESYNQQRRERAERRSARRTGNSRKKRKDSNTAAQTDDKTGDPQEPADEDTVMDKGDSPMHAHVAEDLIVGHADPDFCFRGAVLLEALSATGLRSIRYAHEIPALRYIIANDLSPAATTAMRRNVEFNGLGPQPAGVTPAADADKEVQSHGKVRVSEADACTLMYSHRTDNIVDCVDLDPYGTAAPFVDSAVQCINDGGLLCVTCTDMAVLATNNYPEKCFANYGGIPLRGEYCHEAALRLVLHSLSTSAARYGRYITPLLSLSIDFYVRIFVRVQTGQRQVKNVFSKTAMYYICTGCQAWFEEPLGRVLEKVDEASGNINPVYRTHPGPSFKGGHCPYCESNTHATALQIAGPMWRGPLHDTDFVDTVLAHTQEKQDNFGTAARMIGMLTLARQELVNPFYITPSRVASSFQCTSPSFDAVASALVNGGYAVSRSHAVAGSVKTDAPTSVVHDIFRAWVEKNPVKYEKVKDGSHTARLLAVEPVFKADLTINPVVKTKASNVKIVRYQHNPTKNWGPGMRPGKKRRAESQERA